MLQTVTRAEDLILVQEINVLGPIKSKFKDNMIQQYLEIKLLKWEAMELVRKANEYAIKTELMHKKEFKKLPYEYSAAIGFSMIVDDLKLVEDAINEASEMMRDNKANIGEKNEN